MPGFEDNRFAKYCARVAPLLDGQARSLPQLARDWSATGNSWEIRNDAAWNFYGTLFAPAQALLLAGIGVQVGAWSRGSVTLELGNESGSGVPPLNQKQKSRLATASPVPDRGGEAGTAPPL